MSVKVGSENLHEGSMGGQRKDSYGLPVQEGTSRAVVTKSETPRKAYGVRVPVLRDLDGKYVGRQKPTSCRFDIVEKVTTVIKPGAYGPSGSDSGSNRTPRNGDENCITRISRQQTYYSTVSNSTRQSDNRNGSVLEKIGPYEWHRWIKPAKEGDARDVLYRNTYCQDPENVRYRTLTLPRISTTPGKDRPWTVTGDDKPVVTQADHGEYSKVVTIIPQQPRGTIVRFQEYMKPYTRESDDRSMEVRRFTRKPQNNHFTTVKSELPLIRHDFRRSPKKSERPLKFENTRFTKKQRETLYNKHILPAYKSAFDRDYSSADTFREYLENLQHTAKANTPGLHNREWANTHHKEKRQSTDYHNRVLQSVSDVNQPGSDEIPDNHEISVEIKQSKQVKPNQSQETANTSEIQKPVNIDNLSSVHGSVVQAHSETQSVTVPKSSSIVDGKSIVKIPSVVAEPINVPAVETDENPTDTVDGIEEKTDIPDKEGVPENKLNAAGDETACPTNTPTPNDPDPW